jgi:hypothetical protein
VRSFDFFLPPDILRISDPRSINIKRINARFRYWTSEEKVLPDLFSHMTMKIRTSKQTGNIILYLKIDVTCKRFLKRSCRLPKKKLKASKKIASKAAFTMFR